MCWQLNTVPTTLDYEVDGVDAGGHEVRATLKVDFKSLDQKGGAPNPGDVSRISRSTQWSRK